ncbi:FAD-binding oxidoreductase [Micromonospora sp. 4G57]|uniref:FAD-binding oxidoreductase n=1 Tax=Micromonospora sicca TaxID=2202420 RepID=A0ABU5J5W4_9ACTN|nr:MULTISPECIES: FAD-binding oxidoreductase [unclassified Micromonospora]MDZ5444931.1 FAD-binding oxidoreductase [Micromonospora sp. 4G57]MDZ5487909.1 FAD-binding oxidoreductase [Micromonospora sp. 4G53]
MPADAILDRLRAAADGTTTTDGRHTDGLPSQAAAGRTDNPDGPEPVRPAGEQDAIAGVPARYVAMPRDTAQAAALLRAAAALDLAVTFRGGGTKQDWGSPPRRLDLIVGTTALAGVVEHAAGDLITVVRAGTRLDALAAALAAAGQQLALDAPLPGGTVGGAVATNASGPRRMLYGTARDLLIGVTLVRADGVVAHAGGKVVKNVAGYDLGKLVTGAYGTLGLVTECAFRLHPLPAAAAYVTRRVDDAAEAGRLAGTVRAAQLVPAALEVDAPAGGGAAVTVLLEGTPAGVAARAEAAARLLGADATAADQAPEGWGRYPWRDGDTGLKLTAALSGVPRLLADARAAADRHGVPLALRGSAGVGVLHAGVPGTAEPERVAGLVDALRAATAAVAGHAVVLTAPPTVRDRVDLWGPVDGLALMRRVKQRFDPDARLAPGRFVGGI